MICYQDRTFCISPGCRCMDKLTRHVIEGATEWWKGMRGAPPIAVAFLHGGLGTMGWNEAWEKSIKDEQGDVE